MDKRCKERKRKNQAIRCAYSGKMINKNDEVILVKNLVAYARKLGYLISNFKFVFMFLFLFLLISNVSSFPSKSFIDNSRNFDSSVVDSGLTKNFYSLDKRIEIKDGKDFLINFKLDTPYIYSGLIASSDTKVAELTLLDWKDDVNLFDSVSFYDVRNNYNLVNRDFVYKYLDSVKTECFDDSCFDIYYWVPFDSLDELPHKNIKIGLFSYTYPNERIEWVPEFFDFVLYEFAEWDVSSYFYDDVNITPNDALNDLHFKPDGTIFYIIDGDNAESLQEYHCTDAWNISSCSFYQSSSIVTSQDADEKGIYWKPDGTRFYFTGEVSNSHYQYSCTDAWNISSCSYDIGSNISSVSTNPTSIWFKDDGLIMFELEYNQDQINEFSCTDAWNLSSCSYDSNSLSIRVNQASDFYFKSDGTKIYVAENYYKRVDEFSCTDAWNLSSCSYTQDISILGGSGYARGIYFSSDGSKMYVGVYSPSVIMQFETEPDSPPEFVSVPDDDSIVYGNYWDGVDFDAEDNIGIDSYFVNDSRFTINQSGFLNMTNLLSAGIYQINVSVNDTIGQEDSFIYTLTINKASSVVYAYIQNLRNNYFTDLEGDLSVDLNGTLITGFGDIYMYLDDVLINSGSSPLYNLSEFSEIGTYVFKVNVSESQNYTSAYESFVIDISEYADTSVHWFDLDFDFFTGIIVLILFVSVCLLIYVRQVVFAGFILIILGFGLLFSGFTFVLSILFIAGGVVCLFIK